MRKFTVTVNGVAYNVEVNEGAAAAAPVAAAPAPAPVAAPAPAPAAAPAPAPAAEAAPAPAAAAPVAAGDTAVDSPMPGKITSIGKKVGDAVSEGDEVMVLEAMKLSLIHI